MCLLKFDSSLSNFDSRKKRTMLSTALYFALMFIEFTATLGFFSSPNPFPDIKSNIKYFSPQNLNSNERIGLMNSREYNQLFSSRFSSAQYALQNRITTEEFQAANKEHKVKVISVAIRERVKVLYKKAEANLRRGNVANARELLYKCVGLDSKDGHSWLKLARLEQNSGNRNKARQIFAESVENNPGNVHLWQAWAVLESKYGNIEKARELFAKARDLDEGNPYVCHAWGLLEQKEGNLERARELYQITLQTRPQAQVCVALGELEASLGNLEEARRVFAKGVDQITSDLPELLMGWARIEETVGHDTAKASNLLRQALELAPHDTKIHMGLASLEARSGNTTAVREILSNTQHLDHHDGTMYNMWAHFEAKLGNIRDAIKILVEARARLPLDQTLPQAQGILEEKLGEYETARGLYEHSIHIRPNAPAYLAWGRMESQLGENSAESIEKARRLFQHGLKVDPSHGPLYNAYALMEASIGDESEALRILTVGLENRCDARGSVWHGLGKLALKNNNDDKARDYLRKGIEDVKTSEDVSFLYHSWGMLELNSHRLSEAFEIFGEGIQRYPHNSQLLLGAALAHIQLGCIEEARVYFRRSVQANKKHAHAYQAWGVLEARLGNYQTAAKLYDQGLRASPNHGALWQAYGYLVMQHLKDIKRARNIFQEGIKRCPDHVHLYQALTCLEVKEGNLNKARETIKTAIMKDPTHGACWTAFAVIEQKSGFIEKAREVYKQGLRYASAHGPLYRSYALLEISQKNYNRAKNIFQAGLEADPLCASLYHSFAELEASLGNIEGLNTLNKKTKDLFNVDIPARTKEEYLKRMENLELNFMNYDQDGAL
mmetsp:Transcript_39769/g.52430  ORF Transcript_39769/g.52430 Transcript_39769/m.52430 type:complete len:840 (+) Transcript_39769:86-2605(+)